MPQSEKPASTISHRSHAWSMAVYGSFQLSLESSTAPFTARLANGVATGALELCTNLDQPSAANWTGGTTRLLIVLFFFLFHWSPHLPQFIHVMLS
jgi:hypothetical protein